MGRDRTVCKGGGWGSETPVGETPPNISKHSTWWLDRGSRAGGALGTDKEQGLVERSACVEGAGGVQEAPPSTEGCLVCVATLRKSEGGREGGVERGWNRLAEGWRRGAREVWRCRGEGQQGWGGVGGGAGWKEGGGHSTKGGWGSAGRGHQVSRVPLAGTGTCKPVQ